MRRRVGILSLIIPVLNEAERIQIFLQALQKYRKHGVDIIVVDGGSRDFTIALARPLCDALIETKKGRAKQMNAGASLAKGDILLFLHADTLLPDNFLSLIEKKMQESASLWGRFDVCLSGTLPSLRMVEFFINYRSRWTGIATGDQAIFVNSAMFKQLQGYPDIPLMEDVALSKKMKKITPPLTLREKVTTSSRRWEKYGVWSTIFLMWKLRLAYFLGVSPQCLVARYDKK